MQKDRTTLALAILVVLLGAIAPESFWIRVLASAFAVFLIFWGRDSERTEAWVSRLPVGGQLLTKWLHQLDLIVSPRDQDYEEHLRRVISGYDAKQRKFLRRLLDTRAYRSIPIGEWERFNKDNLVEYTHGAPGPIKPEFRDPISRILGELDVQDSDST